MTVFLAADLEAIPGTKPSTGGTGGTSAAPSNNLETAALVAPSTGSASQAVETGHASVAVETAFTAPAFVASAPTASAVTLSASSTAPAFTFAPEQVGSVALNSPASSVAAMDSQFFSFGASASTYISSSEVIENWGQNDVVGPAVFHFVEAASWSAAESDSGGSWFTDWLYDLLA